MTRPINVKLCDHDQVLPGGFRFPTRMTALPLEGGGCALVSPTPIDDRMAEGLAAVGEVRYLIAPNLLHHLYLAAANARFPRAQVLAPRRLRDKRPDLRVDADLEDGLPAELGRSLSAIKIEGAPQVDEFALLHRATRTLVLTDLVFNVVRPRGVVAHLALYLMGCHGKLAQSRAWRVFVKDRGAASASVERLLGLDFEVLVPAHGEVVSADARAALRDALRWLAPRPAALIAAS